VLNDPQAWEGNYYDFVLMAANMYYQNSAVHTAMTRNLLAGNEQYTGCNDSQYGGCFNGSAGGGGQWPDLPFMFGNLEGVVDPYTLTGASPTCAITTDGGNGAGENFSTSTATLATFAGDGADSDGTVTGVAWTCATCTPTSDTATCVGCPGASITWSEASITLGTGANTLEVTVTDSDSNICTDQIVVTYNPPAATVAPFRLVR
jgi:hypothetical protein